jgi:hypothetical protein
MVTTRTRREWLTLWVAGLLAARTAHGTGASPANTQNDNAIEIWKTPTCGCCRLWVDHMRANGFRPTVHDVNDVSPIKRKLGVPATLESCHTGIVSGYAVEGHVPADVVRQMLKQRPKIAGLAVAGMPMGSPGMEQGSRKDPYNVMAFERSGRTSVFAKR